MKSQNISVLVIESDLNACIHLKGMLKSKQIAFEIVCVDNPEEALFYLLENSPDLIFMEFPTSDKSEKDLIKYVNKKLEETTLVLVSRSKQFAAQAIRNEIYDFLIKPVNSSDLIKIIEKVDLLKQNNSKERINSIIEKSNNETRLRFQTIRGYILIDPAELIYCKAEGCYTELYLTNERIEYSYIFISKLTEILSTYDFIRISRSNLINNKFVRKIVRDNNIVVLKTDSKEIEIKASKTMLRKLGKSIL